MFMQLTWGKDQLPSMFFKAYFFCVTLFLQEEGSRDTVALLLFFLMLEFWLKWVFYPVSYSGLVFDKC